MRYVSYIVAMATLAGAVAGPYYPRSGYSQGYYQQPSYGYYPQPSYSYYSPGYAYR